MNETQAAVARALTLCQVLDVAHESYQLHATLRAIRHELLTLQALVGSAIVTAACVELPPASFDQPSLFSDG